MNKRKIFSKEFEIAAVRQLELGDKPGTDIALNLGILRNLLYKWKEQLSQHKEGAFQGSGRRPTTQRDELGRLKKELADVTMERDILKKAAAYFARDLT